MANKMYWEIEISHRGLNKYRQIRGTDKNVVEQKARAQQATWDEMWQKKQAADRKRKDRENKAQEKEAKKQLAITETDEAENEIKQLEEILLKTLSINDAINWEDLKDKNPFRIPKPPQPKFREHTTKPSRKDKIYNPELGFFTKLFKSKVEKITLKNDELFNQDLEKWNKEKSRINSKNNKLQVGYDSDLREWELKKQDYLKKQQQVNVQVEGKKEKYLNLDSGAIYDYCDLVLTNSDYPDYFPQEFNLDYNPENKILVIDYSLPNIESLPTVKEVKYIQSRDEFKKSYISDAVKNKLYDSILYQIALRSIHEIFEADIVEGISAIVFNGWVNSIDKGTGNEVNACVLTVQTSKEEFLKINLENVDPKRCFKNLKGVGSSKLHSLIPVAPIITINREDSRFVSSYDVADELDETSNLAAMDWEDFEHLIRELFEKEFQANGGEVKVTQASRDGGVDAIAFDPDPIRGGKIVIQAKRYTNTVGVSAVRDLYGTVVNEGATKGILVSTADYGPDAYEFAKGKPLSLLNGSNLLHLLEKHGHKAKIDLKEAKRILAEKEM